MVVLEKDEYLRLLAEASIHNVTKFRIVERDRPKCRGRPPKHYLPLLQKEKELESLVRRVLPTAVAESVPSVRFQAGPPSWFAQNAQERVSYATYSVSYTDLQLCSGKMAR